LRVKDLLDVPDLGLRLLTNATDLDRSIKHVFTTDLPDPGRYLTPGDLVLTGEVGRQLDGDRATAMSRFSGGAGCCCPRWPREPAGRGPRYHGRLGGDRRRGGLARALAGGRWNSCATRMRVHVNTVRYRIRRIEELTGRNLSCLDDQVDFFLALRVR
jgi:hypothetical protein